MSSLMISLVAVGSIFVGALLGGLLRRILPHDHLNADSRDVVKLGAGLVATTAALVLGLLVSSAKSTFDSVNSGLTQGGAKLILLDRSLERYGPEAKEARAALRSTLATGIEQLWPSDHGGKGGIEKIEGFTGLDHVGDLLRELAPQSDAQKLLKAEALQNAGDLKQLRWLLVEQAHGSIPTVLLVILIVWFTVLFAIFGLLTRWNATVMVVIFVCALAVGCGVLLILEMNQPLQGLLKASNAPLENALRHMGG